MPYKDRLITISSEATGDTASSGDLPKSPHKTTSDGSESVTLWPLTPQLPSDFPQSHSVGVRGFKHANLQGNKHYIPLFAHTRGAGGRGAAEAG